MADIRISELDEVTSVTDSDYLAMTVDIGGGVLVTKKIQYSNLMSSSSQKVRGFVIQPNIVYANRPQVVMMRADANITISRIHIRCSITTQELECTVKYADDPVTFPNSAIVAVSDTTSGAVTITSGFTNASVPSGKYVYLLFDAAPNENIDDFYIEIFYSYD